MIQSEGLYIFGCPPLQPIKALPKGFRLAALTLRRGEFAQAVIEVLDEHSDDAATLGVKARWDAYLLVTADGWELKPSRFLQRDVDGDVSLPDSP